MPEHADVMLDVSVYASRSCAAAQRLSFASSHFASALHNVSHKYRCMSSGLSIMCCTVLMFEILLDPSPHRFVHLIQAARHYGRMPRHFPPQIPPIGKRGERLEHAAPKDACFGGRCQHIWAAGWASLDVRAAAPVSHPPAAAYRQWPGNLRTVYPYAVCQPAAL